MSGALSHVVFALTALVAVVFAMLTVTRRNPIYSAIHLIVFFGTMSLSFLMLYASFLAFMQLLVYAGAIMVLYMFVIMLIDPREESLPPEGGPLDKLFALAVSGTLFVLLFVVVNGSKTVHEMGNFAAMPAPAPTVVAGAPGQAAWSAAHGSIEAFGWEMFSRHLLAFELTSILILIAIVGAVHLSVKSRKVVKHAGPRKVNVIPEHARRRTGGGGPGKEKAIHVHP